MITKVKEEISQVVRISNEAVAVMDALRGSLPRAQYVSQVIKERDSGQIVGLEKDGLNFAGIAKALLELKETLESIAGKVNVIDRNSFIAIEDINHQINILSTMAVGNASAIEQTSGNPGLKDAIIDQSQAEAERTWKTHPHNYGAREKIDKK